MAYFDERQKQIILSEEEKETFRECNQAIQDPKNHKLLMVQMLENLF